MAGANISAAVRLARAALNSIEYIPTVVSTREDLRTPVGNPTLHPRFRLRCHNQNRPLLGSTNVCSHRRFLGPVTLCWTCSAARVYAEVRSNSNPKSLDAHGVLGSVDRYRLRALRRCCHPWCGKAYRECCVNGIEQVLEQDLFTAAFTWL